MTILRMKNYSMILIKKAAKIPALSSRNANKCEYLAGEEILPSNQKWIVEEAEFTYFYLGKVFVIQTRTIEDQRKNKLIFWRL